MTNIQFVIIIIITNYITWSFRTSKSDSNIYLHLMLMINIISLIEYFNQIYLCVKSNFNRNNQSKLLFPLLNFRYMINLTNLMYLFNQICFNLNSFDLINQIYLLNMSVCMIELFQSIIYKSIFYNKYNIYFSNHNMPNLFWICIHSIQMYCLEQYVQINNDINSLSNNISSYLKLMLSFFAINLMWLSYYGCHIYINRTYMNHKYKNHCVMNNKYSNDLTYIIFHVPIISIIINAEILLNPIFSFELDSNFYIFDDMHLSNYLSNHVLNIIIIQILIGIMINIYEYKINNKLKVNLL